MLKYGVNHETLQAQGGAHGRRAVALFTLSCALASTVFILPLPAFAEARLGENIAVPLSSSIVGALSGATWAHSAVPEADADHSAVEAQATNGQQENFSSRYSMKVK